MRSEHDPWIFFVGVPALTLLLMIVAIWLTRRRTRMGVAIGAVVLGLGGLGLGGYWLVKATSGSLLVRSLAAVISDHPDAFDFYAVIRTSLLVGLGPCAGLIAAGGFGIVSARRQLRAATPG